MTRCLIIICCLFLCACASEQATDTPSYDVAITGGMVIDGSGSEPYAADVLIRDDTIISIGKFNYDDLDIEKTIDATGKVVTPGFIDTHSHGDPLAMPFKNFITQGVTTIVLGQDGRTTGLNADNMPTMDQWRTETDGTVTSLASWMQAVENKGIYLNIASLVGHGTMRLISGTGINTEVTDQQLANMTEILQSAMDAGAYGMSSGLEYVPGRYAPEKEVMHLAKIVGENDGLIMSHTRSEDGTSTDPDAILVNDAIDEVIRQAEYARLHIAHIKIVHGKTVDEADVLLGKINSARADGLSVTADVYPYLAGMSNFYFLYPVWARERSVFEEAVINNREKLEKDLYDRIIWRGGAEKALVTSGEYMGKNVAEIAEMQGKPFTDVIIDWGYGGPQTAHFTQDEAVQDKFITALDVAIGTDGAPSMHHPRSFGTYTKMIEKYVVSEGKLTLPQVVYKMSGLPAEIIGLKDRGTLSENNKADILIFDPANIKSNATWLKPEQYSEGFDYVIVNGEVAVEADRLNENKFGMVLRKQ